MFVFVAGSQLCIWCLWPSFRQFANVSQTVWRTFQWHSYKLGCSVGDCYYKGMAVGYCSGGHLNACHLVADWIRLCDYVWL